MNMPSPPNPSSNPEPPELSLNPEPSEIGEATEPLRAVRAETEQHARNIERLKIARLSILTFSALLAFVILLVPLYAWQINPHFPAESFLYIMGTVITGLFGTITLALGFVAGTTIDK